MAVDATARRSIWLLGSLLIASLAVPLILWRWPIWLTQTAGSGFYQVFYTQGFILAGGLILLARYHYDVGLFRLERLPELLLLIACIVQVQFATILVGISYDYTAYAIAADRLNAGLMYAGGQYFYSPLFAGVLQAIKSGLASVLIAQSAQDIDSLRFYLYQSTLLYFSFAIIFALYKFGKQRGLTPLTSAAISSGLMIASFPLLRAFEFNQASIIIAFLTVCSFLYFERPVIVGLCIAAAGSIKLYPFIALVFFIQSRQWKYLIATLSWSVVLVAIGIVLTGLGPWSEFVETTMQVIKEGAYQGKGNASITEGLSTIANALGLPILSTIAKGILVIAVFAVSFLAVRESAKSEHLLLVILSVSSLAGLTLSPVLWQHHFLIVLSVLMYAYAADVDRNQLFLAVAALFWIPGIPSFLSTIATAIGIVMLWRCLINRPKMQPTLRG
jgi:hypothetical protein